MAEPFCVLLTGSAAAARLIAEKQMRQAAITIEMRVESLVNGCSKVFWLITVSISSGS